MRELWQSVRTFSVLLLVCLSTVQAKRKKRKEPVDFTVVDDSTIQNTKTSPDGLPADVNVNFDVLGNVVSLHLKRNPKVVSAKDTVYVIRKSKNGVPVLVSQIVNDVEIFGEYQDPQNNAIFTLACPANTTNSTNNSTQKCDATMEGTFRSGNEEYRMSILEESAMHNRVRRNAVRNNKRNKNKNKNNKKINKNNIKNNKKDKLWKKAKKLARAAKRKSKVYGIFKTEASPNTPSDFKVADPIIRGRVSAAFGHHAKTVRENALPGDRMYNVEVLVVVDYGLYERFYKASQAGTEAAKDNEAKYNLKKYFSHVFNGVDMLYKSIDDPDFTISVAISGFVIADTPQSSVWTTPHMDRVRDGRHELLVSIPLDEVFRWSLRASNIPENDHIMLFTDYDLYSLDSGSKDIRTAGYARVSSVCSIDSVSVVEDHGGFQSINAAAHELGHSLGSRHDGRMNGCNPSDQFVMTAHGGFETDQNRLNPWRFSTCSVNYFKQYVNSLPPNNCLTDPVDIFNRAEFLHYVDTYPGQDYTPNQQCQDILGLDSYYGWGPELGGFDRICTEMSCKVPGSGRSYRVYKAATGTSCGDKKWCIEGQCRFEDKAPSKDPQCVFGDTQRRFGSNRSCREYMIDNPMRCYDSFYRTRCCDTCDKLNTGVQGCEYGDKFLNCRQSGCWDRSYARDCCSTCGLAPHPVIRPVDPPTRVTTTTTTRRPITMRPTMRPARPTTRRPAPPTRPPTTRRPVAPPPSGGGGNGLTPSGNSGMCIRDNSNFLLFLSCSRLPSIFGASACDNPLAARFCCEPCPAPGETRCVDQPSCTVQYARECYIAGNKDTCCSTCKRFETNNAGCEYGDRIRSCQRYVSELGLGYVCSRYRSYCCGICNAMAARAGTVPMNAMAMAQNSSRSAEPLPAVGTAVVSDLVIPDAAPTAPVISAGGQRRGLRRPRGRSLAGFTIFGRGPPGGRRRGGRGNNRGGSAHFQVSPRNNTTAAPAKADAGSSSKGTFVPLGTIVFRMGSPQRGNRSSSRGRGRGPRTERPTRGVTAQRKNTARFNFVISG